MHIPLVILNGVFTSNSYFMSTPTALRLRGSPASRGRGFTEDETEQTCEGSKNKVAGGPLEEKKNATRTQEQGRVNKQAD